MKIEALDDMKEAARRIHSSRPGTRSLRGGLRERARDRRRDVEAAVELFFDALVGAVCGEFARLVPESAYPRRGDPTRPRIRFGSRPAEEPGFVVRREQARLFDAVFSEAAPHTVLTGAAGSGKSQLATAHCAASCEGSCTFCRGC